MKKFLNAYSANKETPRLIAHCLDQLGDVPPDATLGFLYVSDFLGEQLASILEQFKAETGVQYWVGTVGIGVLANGHEYHDQSAISLMIADFNEADFCLLPNFTKNMKTYDETLANWCKAQSFNVGLIHGDPDNRELPYLLEQLSNTIPESFLVGGISSSRGIHYQLADGIHHGGISGILFSENIQTMSNLSQGCTPIGPRHRITQSENNIIFSLDNRPALDVLIEDTGEVIAKDWESASKYIFAGLLNKNSDTNDYTIRHLLGISEDDKLVAVADNLEDGQEIIFCRRDGNTAQHDMQRMLLQLKTRLGNKTPRGGIYVSCVGRGREQFGTNSEEVRLIHSVLGDFPLTGFFANGEIHKNYLYAFTGVLTLFV